jgi:hypothetical protein
MRVRYFPNEIEDDDDTLMSPESSFVAVAVAADYCDDDGDDGDDGDCSWNNENST